MAHKPTKAFTAADIERHYQGTVFDWLKWYEEQVASLRRAVEGSRGDPNDFFAILHPAQEFICQWLKEKMPPQQVDTKLDKEAFASRADDEYHRALVELLRGGVPLDNGLRRAIADDLECFYFPTHARVIARNMRRRLTEASVKFSQIEFLMDPEKLDREFALTMHRKHVPKRPPLSESRSQETGSGSERQEHRGSGQRFDAGTTRLAQSRGPYARKRHLREGSDGAARLQRGRRGRRDRVR